MIIGLTGKTGSGKSTVSEMLKDKGFFVCDADRVARQVVERGEPLTKRLAEEFGSDIINQDGTLDRALLAQRAFATREETEKLNRLMHPAIIERSLQQMREALSSGYKAAFYDAAVLFESGADAYCDKTICVFAPAEIRFERIVKRDGLTEKQATERMNAQNADSYYLEKADYVIDNSKGDDLSEQVESVIRQLGL